MFIIIGGDGKEYGPVNADQVRAWITGGRANLETRAKALGSDEWRRVGDFAEFATPGELVPATTSVAPDAPGALGAPDVMLAERVTRLAAWFVDNIVGFIACLPGFMLLGMSAVQAMLTGERDLEALDTGRLALGGFVLMLGVVIFIAVQVWLLTTRGQTVGKRLLGIRIVRFGDNANPGFVIAVLLRSVVPGLIGVLPYVGFIFTIVNYCFIFRDDRRCIHDHIAGTKVVKV
jgi:uncharacterized RDD family membrane protein YckC